MREQTQEEINDHKFELILKLIEAIKQEQLSPTILFYEEQIFKTIKAEIDEQKKSLKDYYHSQDDDESSKLNKSFKYMLYSAELDKMEYLLKMYLKIRIKKIQKFCFFLTKNPNEAEKHLSNSELNFLKAYADMRYSYYKDNALKHMTKVFRDFKGIQSYYGKNQEEQREKKIFVATKQSEIEIISPNMRQYCFILVLNNSDLSFRYSPDWKVSNLNVETMEVVSTNSIFFCPYQVAAEKMNRSQFKLI